MATSQFDSDAFVQLLTEFQSRLYVYILSVVANDRSANDILSDTNATLWQKREEFQIGTSFRCLGVQGGLLSDSGLPEKAA